jgi:ribosomal protein L22
VTDENEQQREEEAAEQKPRRRRRARSQDKPQEAAAEKATAPEPATQRGRPAAADGARPPVVAARAKYVRSSARKARVVSEHLQGKTVEEARAILAFTPRGIARDWSKVLESAVANAEHNHELVGDDLRIEAAYADEGPTLKRYRPRAMGRATRIRKRTTHLTIKLTPKETIT